MTLPRLIFIGMAILAFGSGAIVEGLLYLALVCFLVWHRPSDHYASWR